MPIPHRLKGDEFWDKPHSYEELVAVNASLQSSIKRALELTPWEILEAGLGFIGDDGTLILAPGSTEGPRRQVVEDNSGAIAVNIGDIETLLRYRLGEFVATAPSPGTSSVNAQKKLTVAVATLVGGTLANVPLIPALAGFRAVLTPIALFADTADEYTLAFQDEDDAGLFPATAQPIAVDIKHPNEVSPIAATHGVAGDNSGSPPSNIFFYTQAVNKAIEVDIAGGTGTENLAFWFFRHYEVI